MPSENFDKKIKEAAEHEASFNHEHAWEKMETLLNKHLPQERKRRNMFFFLLFGFLLLGGGAFIIISKPFSQDKGSAITETPAGTNKPVREAETNTTNNKPLNTITNSEKNIPAGQTERKVRNTNPVFVPQLAEKNLKRLKNNNQENVSVSKEVKSAPEPTESEEKQSGNNQVPPVNQNIPSNEEKNAVNEVTKNGESAEIRQEQQETRQGNKRNKPPNEKKGFLTNLAFTVSAGPDFSFVEINDAGRLRPTYGAGLSYPVTKHLTLRSGFFVARKIYSAAPAEYNPPPGFWAYYPNLKRIDADCKIYDVPLNADYNFGKNWFASLGVSNLFMKKETYSYLYKPLSSPQYVSYTHTYNNENSHYFSVLNISGGYSRKLSNAVSIHAEPYLKLPLAGIGHGKIKLGSGGVLFTASIKPFAAKPTQKQ